MNRPAAAIDTRATRGNARGAIGGLIGLAFGWLWLLIGGTAAGEARLPLMVAGSLLFAAAGWRLLRRGRPGGGGPTHRPVTLRRTPRGVWCRKLPA